MKSSHEKVLIVDDDEDIGVLLQKPLTGSGCDISFALSLEEAREKLREEEFSIMVLDLRFPGDRTELSGLKFIPEVKRDYPDLSIIILSGNSENKTILEAFNAGISGYIAKPFKISEVLEMIDKINDLMEKETFQDALDKAYFRVGKAYKIGNKALDEASIEANRMIKEGQANGVIIEAYIRSQEGV